MTPAPSRGAVRAPRTGYERRPARKRFGQHFLERTWAAKVVRAIAPAESDVVLEIGPGRGALTRPLAAHAQVIAFELDRDLAADLSAEQVPRLSVVPGDFLAVSARDLQSMLSERVPAESILRVAGNLPYNVASPILFRVVDLYRAGLPVHDATVMLQREVADRLLARPGTRDYGVLTVLIGQYATIERRLDLPPGAFRPAPRVHSTVVRLTFHEANPPVTNPEGFRALVKAIFTQRRKTLSNALSAYLKKTGSAAAVLADATIDGRRRPETLTLEELAALSEAVERAAGPTVR